jgi:hypothetical protein
MKSIKSNSSETSAKIPQQEYNLKKFPKIQMFSRIKLKNKHIINPIPIPYADIECNHQRHQDGE